MPGKQWFHGYLYENGTKNNISGSIGRKLVVVLLNCFVWVVLVFLVIDECVRNHKFANNINFRLESIELFSKHSIPLPHVCYWSFRSDNIGYNSATS